MDKEYFIEKRPYMYHLTDRRNINSIMSDKKIFSTVSLVNSSEMENSSSFLKRRRDKESRNTPILVDGVSVYIRDQHPINSALYRCLTDGVCTVEQFIYHLNKRVFMWPSYKRMYNHFQTYKNDNPIILRFSTQVLFELNPNNIKLSKINSGATRCVGYYGGNPAPRGLNTFKTFAQLADSKIGDIAEVTFENECKLPESFYISNLPNGPWSLINC